MKKLFLALVLLAAPAWGQSMYNSPFIQEQMQADDAAYARQNRDMQNAQVQRRFDEQQRQIDNQMIQMEEMRDRMNNPALFSDKNY